MRRLGQLRRDESGFTLVELLVAMAIGSIVLGAAMILLDSGARSSTRTIDRAEVSKRGRVVMTIVQRSLRSQVCLDEATPPIVSGDGNSVTYYADTDGDAFFVPQKHVLAYDSTWKGGRGAITDTVYTPDQTATTGPPWTYTAAPAVKRLAEDVTLTPGNAFLTYYAWDNPSTAMTTPLSTDTTGDDLPANSIARVIHVDVSFRVLPGRTTNATGAPVGTQTDANRDNDFTTSAYVRNSAYTDQDDDTRVWGPRCG